MAQQRIQTAVLPRSELPWNDGIAKAHAEAADKRNSTVSEKNTKGPEA